MAAEQKISAALEKEFESVDKDCIRPLQVKAFECCGNCCKDRQSSQTIIQSCLQNCMRPVMESEERLKIEVQNLQGRVSRCAQQCQDSVMDMLPPNATQDDQQRASARAQECLMKCADTNIPLIKKMVDRFKQQNRCS